MAIETIEEIVIKVKEKTEHLPKIEIPRLDEPIPFMERAEVALEAEKRPPKPGTELPKRRALIYVAGRDEKGIVASIEVGETTQCLLNPTTYHYTSFLDYKKL